MPLDKTQELLTYIQGKLGELDKIHEQAEKALNAVQGKEQVTKWKKKVIEELAPFLSKGYVRQISNDWIDTTYFVGDVFDELADEIDMCRRHLLKLTKEIQSKGIP